MRWNDSPILHRLAGHAALATTACFRRLPQPIAYGLADMASLGIVAYTLLHERRVAPQGRGLFRNQRIVFRERWSRSAAWRLLFAWARHMAYLFVDFCRIPRIDSNSVSLRVDSTELEKLRPLYDEGRGLVCVTGHLGVWELCGHVPSLLGVPVTVVARPTGIAPLDEVITDIRSAGGQRVLSKRKVLLPLKTAVQRGEPVGFLADEDSREAAVFVPFLGTLAASNTAAAFLQRVSGAPIAVVSCHRTGRERYRYHVWRVIRPETTDDRNADLARVTAQINEALSRAILAYPEQWFWGSRRFLTRPPGELADEDGLPPRAAAPEAC